MGNDCMNPRRKDICNFLDRPTAPAYMGTYASGNDLILGSNGFNRYPNPYNNQVIGNQPNNGNPHIFVYDDPNGLEDNLYRGPSIGHHDPFGRQDNYGPYINFNSGR